MPEYLSTSAFMQQADSLIEFRKVLELGLVALAAEKADEADWAAMREVLAEQEAALASRPKHPARGPAFPRGDRKANIRFHKAVAAATRNPLAIMVLQAISEPLVEVSRRTNEMPGVPEAGLRQHWVNLPGNPRKQSRQSTSRHAIAPCRRRTQCSHPGARRTGSIAATHNRGNLRAEE